MLMQMCVRQKEQTRGVIDDVLCTLCMICMICMICPLMPAQLSDSQRNTNFSATIRQQSRNRCYDEVNCFFANVLDLRQMKHQHAAQQQKLYKSNVLVLISNTFSSLANTCVRNFVFENERLELSPVWRKAKPLRCKFVLEYFAINL